MMCSAVSPTLESQATPGIKAARDTLNGAPIQVRDIFDKHANLLESLLEETVFLGNFYCRVCLEKVRSSLRVSP